MNWDDEYKFWIEEYGVVLVVLVLSMGIGIFFGCCKQKSTERYFKGNRQMPIIPVALSLLCSFVSLIGISPTEIYMYGSQFGIIILSFIPLTIALSFFYVPVFFDLHVNSVYQYLELRFNRGTQIFMSFLSIFHSIIYMTIIVYSSSLALEQVTGINTRLSTGAIFIVCILYSALGGLKAIIWTEFLQAIIILGSLAAVVIKGMSDIGVQVVFSQVHSNDRLEFFNFDPDPRTRHTFWTATLGGFFMLLPMYAATQQQFQRYTSLPTLASCRRALLITMIGLFIFTILWYLAGLVMYAKYFDCNTTQVLISRNRLLPQFMMEMSAGIPFLPGLFAVAIICSSLSTISSGLNTISSIICYDFFKYLSSNVNDERLSTISKFVTVFFGAISFGCIFIAETLEGLMPATTEISLYIMGIIVGPTLGLFTLGMFFPWANAKGAILGVFTTIIIMLSQVIGTYWVNVENLLPNENILLTTEGCPQNLTNLSNSASIDLNNQDDLLQILSISYMWQPAIGVILTILLGLIFSFFFMLCCGKKTVRVDLFSPPIYYLWNKLFPTHLATFVDPDAQLMLLSSHQISLNLQSPNLSYYRKEPLCDIKIKSVDDCHWT